jgi:hypothetical protein
VFSRQIVGTGISFRLGIFSGGSGNGRRDFLHDNDDDKEFKAASRYFRSISSSFASLAKTLPHKTLQNGRYDQAKLEARMRERPSFPIMGENGTGKVCSQYIRDTSEQIARNARFEGILSNLEDAELLDLLSRGEMDIYIGVLVAVCHLEPVGRVLSGTSVQLNLYVYATATAPPHH